MRCSMSSTEERLRWRILHRHKDGVDADIDEILERSSLEERSDAAVTILNTVLLPAMKEVGDRFGAGELILPFVLQSAEVMKNSVAHLEQFLERQQGISKGRIVLATVYGDVHDIGKSLVRTILANNGYEVHDLGKQVPANVIIDQAIDFQADAIGLSALLVSTSKQMPLIVNELQRRGLSIPVLIGGAAINRRFARRILFTDGGDPYAPGVYYCKDAFEGLHIMDQLQDDERRSSLVAHHLEQAQRERDAVKPAERPKAQRSNIKHAETIPSPPSWGPRVVAEMPLEIVFQDIFKKELFRLSWGAKNAQGAEWEELKTDFERRLTVMQAQALAEGWLQPKGVYGYWPAQSQGDDLVLFTPDSVERGDAQELLRFTFPRQPKSPGLCLADYFASLDSGAMDVVALQVVTVGAEATARVDTLQESGDYSEAYYAHGLAVQTAEAAAQYLHRHIRRELGIGNEQGKRYSWGYPSIPDLNDHAKVFQLLPAEQALGMRVSPAFQLIPEQSTAAIILHHPQAKYFNVGVSRVEQLMGEQQNPSSPIGGGEE